MNVRKAALDCLNKLQHPNSRISSVIRNIETRVQPVDLNLLHQLVYGTIRWQGQLDWVLNPFIPNRFRLAPHLRNILRLGAYQLLHLNRIPIHAIIYETVELAKPKIKTSRFVNAVLRNLSRNRDDLPFPDQVNEPIEWLSLSQSYPKWLVERWTEEFGLEWAKDFCQASNSLAPLTVRTNTLKIDRCNLVKKFLKSGIDARKTSTSPEGIQLLGISNLVQSNIYAEGLCQVQDEAAQIIAHLAGITKESSQLVVDVCAAPGGKTTHLAQLMGNDGYVVAMDITDQKIKLVEQNCQRLGITNVETIVASALDPVIQPLSKANIVLVDVPCSGFGTLRRHPDIRWKKNRSQISDLADLQFQILSNVAAQIRAGTIIIYSTCTTEIEENQQVILRFKKQYPNFSVEAISSYLPNKNPTMQTSEGYWQTFPHLHDMDGSFAVRLRKV